MRKLFLTSFEFKTGENQHKESRIVCVHNTRGLLEEEQLELAYEKTNKWFKGDFPESELISLIVHPTIDANQTEEDERVPFYSESVVLGFANDFLETVNGKQDVIKADRESLKYFLSNRKS